MFMFNWQLQLLYTKQDLHNMYFYDDDNNDNDEYIMVTKTYGTT